MSGAAFQLRLRIPLDRFELELDHASDAQSIGFFGASGAGKTTLLEAVAGWRRGSSGRIEVKGRLLLDSERGLDLPPRRRGIGYVPQDGLLFPHLDVERNMLARQRARGLEGAAAEHFERVVSVLELEPLLAREVSTLSGGERQRVVLARALGSDPQMLLLDEPLGALDQPLRRRILPYLLRVREAFDVPLLLVSHDPTEVQALCDEVVVLDAGRVAAVGDPAHVLGDPARSGTDFENLLRGRVEIQASGRAILHTRGGVRVHVPARSATAASHAVYGLRADDVLVARRRPEPLSARNLLPASITELRVEGEDVYLSAHLLGPEGPGPGLRVSLTSGALRDLGLEVGQEVHLIFKTQSCHLLG